MLHRISRTKIASENKGAKILPHQKSPTKASREMTALSGNHKGLLRYPTTLTRKGLPTKELTNIKLS